MRDTPSIHLRDLAVEDMAEITQIYTHYVQSTCYTFEEVAPGVDEMRRRFDAVRAAELPWRVAEVEKSGIAGYVYAAAFRPRSAYRYVVENSVYVHPEWIHRGVGIALMKDLIRECAALGYRQMLAVIGDSTNDASIRLHTRLGFRTIGHQEAVGMKFGRWVDVVQMQLALGDGRTTVPTASPRGYRSA